ncbi:MAG TPA: F0F1 ATP synthase subunit A [Dermatophilaceae bacterium]|nr:F0F1 ATP synthase subunit A [Dermatophilaceae bacterium]
MTVTAWSVPWMSVSTSTEEGFVPPNPNGFYQPLFNVGPVEFTRPMLLITIVAAILITWLLVSTRKAAIVPSKGQYFTEQVYDFVRNGIARDMIGHKDFMRFVPLLFSLFIYILLNNWFGSIPPFQNPPMARIALPLGLVGIVYIGYHWVGIRKHGLGGYFKTMMPPGLPVYLAPVIFLLELMTFFAVRPLTLTLRLFGNMFAGHMLMGVFILGGSYLLLSGTPGLMAASIGAFGIGFLMQLLELLIQAVQAYVFTMLAASYFGGAVADEH